MIINKRAHEGISEVDWAEELSKKEAGRFKTIRHLEQIKQLKMGQQVNMDMDLYLSFIEVIDKLLVT